MEPPLLTSSSTSLLENSCQTSDAVPNGAVFKMSSKGQNGTETYTKGRRKSSSGSLSGKFFTTNGYTVGSDSVQKNGQMPVSLDSVNNRKNSLNANGHLSNGTADAIQHNSSETPLQTDRSPSNGYPAVTLKSLKESGTLKQRANSRSKSDMIPSTNGKSNGGDSENNRRTDSSLSNGPVMKVTDWSLYSYKTIVSTRIMHWRKIP
jgi:hypothetical protein